MTPMTPEEIKDVRQRAGMTQQHFAEYLGASLSSVSKWERGEVAPKSQAIIRNLERLRDTIESLG